MAQYQQSVIDRDGPRNGAPDVLPRPSSYAPTAPEAELAARATLRAQIARLEAELSQIVSRRFPFISAEARGGSRQPVRGSPISRSSSAPATISRGASPSSTREPHSGACTNTAPATCSNG